MNKLATAKVLCKNYLEKTAKKAKGVSWTPQIYNADPDIMSPDDYAQWGTLSDIAMTVALGNSKTPIKDKRKLLNSLNFDIYEIPKSDPRPYPNMKYMVYNKEDPRYHSTGAKLLTSGLFGAAGAGAGALGGSLVDNPGLGAAIGGTLGAGVAYTAASGDNWDGREIVTFDGDRPYGQQEVGFINPSKHMQQNDSYGPLFGYKRV